MLTYTAKRVDHAFNWADITIGKINVFNWESFKGYDPEAYFQLAHDKNNIYLRMTAQNDYIKSTKKNINDIVCGDSCMEAFISPPENTDIYFNFEFNSDGVLHLGFGEGRKNRTIIDPELIKKYITIMVDKDNIPEGQRGFWRITAIVNKALFEVVQGKPFVDGAGRGSFYKCGDKVVNHFISWNKIDTDHPDFHTTEYFGNIIFE